MGYTHKYYQVHCRCAIVVPHCTLLECIPVCYIWVICTMFRLRNLVGCYSSI